MCGLHIVSDQKLGTNPQIADLSWIFDPRLGSKTHVNTQRKTTTNYTSSLQKLEIL